VHKENNIKIKNTEEYKKPLAAHRVKLSLAKKKLVYDSTHVSHNSSCCKYKHVNIEQIKLIYKFFKTYASST
jgi:hypothetical protein